MNLPDILLPPDRKRFDSIREAEFRPSSQLSGLKQLRGKAKNELGPPAATTVSFAWVTMKGAKEKSKSAWNR